MGALLRSHPDARLWCLRNEGYVAAATGNLLPRHVTVHCVTVSLSPERGLVGIEEASLALPAPSLSRRWRQPQSGVACHAVQVCVPFLLPVLHCPLHDRQRDQSVKQFQLLNARATIKRWLSAMPRIPPTWRSMLAQNWGMFRLG